MLYTLNIYSFYLSVVPHLNGKKTYLDNLIFLILKKKQTTQQNSSQIPDPQSY